MNKSENKEADKGIWKGWGYLWSLDKDLFRVERPYYVTLDDELTFKSDPDADP